MTLRAVCYPRVSSAGQRERDTIAGQLDELPVFISARGWELVKPVATYMDDGFSAKSGKLAARTGLAALLRDAGAGLFDVVVVAHFDRLTRSEDLAERGMILGALQLAGVRVAEAMGGEVLDLNTGHGDLMASIKAYVAANETRLRSERVRLGKQAIAARGGKPTGKTPYGLAYQRPSLWSLDPVRAPIALEIYERAAGGESCGSIAIDLARRGLPALGPSPWHKGRVRDLIRSRHTRGEWVSVRATRTTVAVPPIVTEELWQAAQRALDANRKCGLRRTKHVYLLEGLGHCGACGAPMRIRTGGMCRQRWMRPSAYACANRMAATRTGPPCNAPAVLIAEADARAWAAICRELEDPSLPAELAAERRGIATASQDWDRDATGYRSHLDRLEKVAAAVLVRFRRGAITDRELDRELDALNRERAVLRAQLATAERARGAATSAQARLGAAEATMGELRAKLAVATPEERRDIVAALVDPGGVTFSGTSIRVELFVPRSSGLVAAAS